MVGIAILVGQRRAVRLSQYSASWPKRPEMAGQRQSKFAPKGAVHNQPKMSHSIDFFGRLQSMKAVQLIVLVIIVVALFLVVNGLFSAWALLELAWSVIISFVNLF